MIPVFENMPSLGWKQKFSGKEHTSLSRKLASSVLITPEGTSNVIPFLLLPFPLHPLLGHFVCESPCVTRYYELSTFSGNSETTFEKLFVFLPTQRTHL